MVAVIGRAVHFHEDVGVVVAAAVVRVGRGIIAEAAGGMIRLWEGDGSQSCCAVFLGSSNLCVFRARVCFSVIFLCVCLINEVFEIDCVGGLN